MKHPDAENIFHRALEFDSLEQRAGYIEGACSGNAELRTQVERLLAAHTGADNLFPTEPGDRTEFVAVSEGPGTVIGKYKLLQQIGEGGMGVVYMAEQHEPFDKRVALKIIKLGMDTKAVVARFEAERQALALMNHPNIAKVLDAGATDTGRPYFVMELVKGVPITEYCDKQKLSTKERLELFIPVCQAIQHAHQKGIIHRDIKPSNVMVALFDGRPVPMVIDFGIAKATNQRLTQQTVFTNLGQLIGTPAYMSPEQAEGSQLDIDTRSDIYSLGVLLYELLTGSQPFPEKQLRSAGWKEMIRIIQEDEPPRPSTRLSTLTDPEQSAMTGAHPEGIRKISLLLRRELDWIVMMCLEKDRAKRYETANGLALDVARYLKGEAIVAVPPTWRYQLSKLARKHKKTFAMAAAIAVILAVATVFSSYQAIRATKAEKIAVEEGRFSGTLNDFLLEDLLSISDVWTTDTRGAPRKAGLTLFEAIQAAEKLASARFADHPETEARVRWIISRAVEGLGQFSAAATNALRAYDLYRELPGFGPNHINTLETKFFYGWALWGTIYGDADRYPEIRELADRLKQEVAETCWAELGADHPFTMLTSADVAFSYLDWAQRPGYTNRVSDMRLAEVFYQRALVSSDRIAKLGDPKLISQKLRAMKPLSAVTWYTDRMPETRVITRRIGEEQEKYRRLTNPEGQYFLDYADNLYIEGIYDYLWSRDFETGERRMKQALAISEPQVGPSAPTGEVYKRLAQLYHEKGDHQAAAKAMFESVRCIFEGKEQPGYASGVAEAGASFAASTGDWKQTLDTLVKMRKWPVRAPVLGREILLRHFMGATSGLPELRQQFWKDAETRTLPAEAGYLMSVPCPTLETNQLAQLIQRATTNGANPELLGMWAYRRGDWTDAVRRLAGFNQASVPNYYLALTYYQLKDRGKAREHLARADQLLEKSLVTGSLLRWSWDPTFWADTVTALILRDEAERLILNAPVPRKPFAEWLADKRAAWEPVRQKMEEADWAARKHNYPKAGRLYEELAQFTNFTFSAANDAGGIPHKMAAVAWALGQHDRQIGLLQQLHADFATNETQYLASLAQPPGPLPSDLEVRRRESRQRKELEAKWANQNPTVQGDDAHLLGMLWFREGKHAEALKALERVTDDMTFILGTSGKTFAAMANWNLGKKDEARRLLKAADERFNRTVIVPGEGMYQPWFPSSIMMEMVLKEADQLIDPDVTNAPHVAALPAEGW